MNRTRRYLLGILMLVGTITVTGCSIPDHLTAPQVCLEWGIGVDSAGNAATVCKKYGEGSWL